MCAAYYDTLKAAFVASSCVRDEIAKSETANETKM